MPTARKTTATKPTKNELIVQLVRQAEDFNNLARRTQTYGASTRAIMRHAAGLLHATIELYRNGTWDRSMAEAWHDAAKITLAAFED